MDFKNHIYNQHITVKDNKKSKVIYSYNNDNMNIKVNISNTRFHRYKVNYKWIRNPNLSIKNAPKIQFETMRKNIITKKRKKKEKNYQT